ncbi:MAG: 50S ribosomal protein L1, partial [Actinobacteria bacterium]|nr:50S ribosomal protein L1 [Actinomycetota bacterium]
MKRSKKYTAAAAKIDANRLYMPLSAMKVVKETNVTKYDASVEVSMVLGV